MGKAQHGTGWFRRLFRRPLATALEFPSPAPPRAPSQAPTSAPPTARQARPPTAAPAASPPTEEESPVSKQSDLHDVLLDLEAALGDAGGAVLASRDGLPIAATVAEPALSRLAAVTATVFALSEQVVQTGRGATLDHVVIRATEGCLAVYGVGPRAALAVRTGARPNIGLLQLETTRAAGELAGLLG